VSHIVGSANIEANGNTNRRDAIAKVSLPAEVSTVGASILFHLR
jgi:hypothetical protein